MRAVGGEKLMTMAEAVRRFVPDGATVAMGTCLEPAIPFAAGHEMIRQGRRDLTLVGPISDALFDQLIGAGCVATIRAAWVGNVSEGLGHCYRRATELGQPRPVQVYDYSNFTISLALWAAAWDAPYLPTRTLLGSDIVRTNPELRVVDGAVRVPPLRPDVAVLHVQRADAWGRAHLWGPLGISEEAGLAARRVILSCEELVDPEVTLSDPNRISSRRPGWWRWCTSPEAAIPPRSRVGGGATTPPTAPTPSARGPRRGSAPGWRSGC
ncbi:MAG TPA: CoA-transferase [Candidatus Dormibacteraeota bacterium]|nr:CoA-transferase [Candidatus Dormibacteraeota bacterium]